MSNDATAVVLTPAILTAVPQSKGGTASPLFACALIANAPRLYCPSQIRLIWWFSHTRHASVPAMDALLWRSLGPFDCRHLYEDALHLPPGTGRRYRSSKYAPSRCANRGQVVLAGIAFMVLVLLAASSLNMIWACPPASPRLAVARRRFHKNAQRSASVGSRPQLVPPLTLVARAVHYG